MESEQLRNIKIMVEALFRMGVTEIDMKEFGLMLKEDSVKWLMENKISCSESIPWDISEKSTITIKLI